MRSREKEREYHRAWEAANRDHVRARSREWDRAHPDSVRASRLGRYGITTAEFDALLAKQGGTCALCDAKTFDKTGRSLAVDHDHLTGRVRGLLCLRCNQALERLELDGWVAAASTYLTTSDGVRK